MMKFKQFYFGFVLGCILKDKVYGFGINLYKKGIKTYHVLRKSPQKVLLLENKIEKIEIVIKIKNKEYFQDLFIKYETDPGYFPEKGIYILNMSNDLVEYINKNKDSLELDIKTLCDLDYLENYDYSYLSSVGDLYLYISYLTDSNHYINVYSGDQLINGNDFEKKNVYSEYSQTICATIKYGDSKLEYVTQHFKKFLNNTMVITPEIILMYYKKLKMNLLNTEFIIVKASGTKNYSLTDKL